ncbi:MAG: STAS domain-containing protein [Fibrobacteres bacterium]|nr:STAS domain-containing protein [Fibrobacterota bacterium]
MEDLQISVKKVGSAAVVKFSGNFDYDLDHVNEELIEKQLSSSPDAIVLDMENVKKMASAFINRLVKILRIVDKEKRRLYLLNVSDQSIKVLSMVNIIGRFSILHSEAELKSLHNSSSAKNENPSSVHLSISRSAEDSKHRLSVSGSIVEGANTSLILDEVKSSLGSGASSIILDLAKVDLLDTISVGILLMIQKMCEDKKVTIKIENPNEVITHVLEMNEVGRLFGL